MQILLSFIIDFDINKMPNVSWTTPVIDVDMAE